MGRPKQLLPFRGHTLIEHCLRTAAAARVEAIVLVTGTLHESLAMIAAPYGARTVRNAEPEGDMASSIRAGRAALPHDTTGVIIHPGDYPLVHPDTVSALIAQHRQNPHAIVRPTSANRHGHPVLFPRALLDTLEEGQTLRDLIIAHPDALCSIAVQDAGILQDIDTPADYAALLAQPFPQ